MCALLSNFLLKGTSFSFQGIQKNRKINSGWPLKTVVLNKKCLTSPLLFLYIFNFHPSHKTKLKYIHYNLLILKRRNYRQIIRLLTFIRVVKSFFFASITQTFRIFRTVKSIEITVYITIPHKHFTVKTRKHILFLIHSM